jgi:hypothetical protein
VPPSVAERAGHLDDLKGLVDAFLRKHEEIRRVDDVEYDYDAGKVESRLAELVAMRKLNSRNRTKLTLSLFAARLFATQSSIRAAFLKLLDILEPGKSNICQSGFTDGLRDAKDVCSFNTRQIC